MIRFINRKLENIKMLPKNPLLFNLIMYLFFKEYAASNTTLTFSTFKYLMLSPWHHISHNSDAKYCCIIEKPGGKNDFVDLLKFYNNLYLNTKMKDGNSFSPILLISYIARVKRPTFSRILLHTYLINISNVVLNHVSMHLNDHGKLIIDETEEVLSKSKFNPTSIAPKKHWRPGFSYVFFNGKLAPEIHSLLLGRNTTTGHNSFRDYKLVI